MARPVKELFDIHAFVKSLREEVLRFGTPVVTEQASRDRDPYKILIATIISLRTKDQVTDEASQRLFKAADKPQRMIRLKPEKIAELIYPAGFYKTKAKRIIGISKEIIEKFNGGVPETIDELLTMKGVGRKTANLVVTEGFQKQGICVDTHVHRIFNRIGYVFTKTPEKTEFELRKKLPEDYWIEINTLLVSHGQNICHAVSPLCSRCGISSFCKRIGVKRCR
ncbi:MAG: endonuclease III [Deltaproteobacteria bacterium]|nr:endonuclease III [Deltaproteobacteria bacterium]